MTPPEIVTLSRDFTLHEFVRTDTGISNKPGVQAIANLSRLVNTVLQPLRTHLGRAVTVTSGFRSPAVNEAVDGEVTSYHLHGLAADIHVQAYTPRALSQVIVDLQLPVDKVINEYGRWVHVQIAAPADIPRMKALTARSEHGRTRYLEGIV